MANMMPSWHSFAQENFLLSLQGVQQPYEDPSLESSLSLNSKSSLYALWHLLNALLAECPESSVILFLYELIEKFLLNTMCLCSMPSWKSSIEPSVVLSSSWTQQSSSVHSMNLLNALLAELYRTPQRFYLLLCYPLHSPTSKVFSNITVSIQSQWF